MINHDHISFVMGMEYKLSLEMYITPKMYMKVVKKRSNVFS